MMVDLLTHVGATMEQTATGVLAVAAAAVLAMGAWEWLRAKLISEWDRDYYR